jgi:undecaprenyl-diphosphatase
VLSGITWIDALLIGVAQAFAIFPGISRSGATISTGLARGLRREEAARFSFLLATPVVLAAGGKKLLEVIADGALAEQGMYLLGGFLGAMVVGYVCIWWLLGFLRRQRLYPFAVYCAAFGVFCLAVAALRA